MINSMMIFNLSNFIDMLIFSIITIQLLDIKVNTKVVRKQLISCIIILIIQSLLYISFETGPWLNLLFFFCYISISAFHEGMNFKEASFSILGYSIIAMSSEAIVMIYLKICSGTTDLNISGYQKIEGMVLTYFFKIIISVSIMILIKKKLNGLKNLSVGTILCTILFSLFSVFWLGYTLIEEVNNNKQMIVNVLGIMFMNFSAYLMILINVKVTNESISFKTANTKLKADLNFVQSLNSNLNQLKSIRHDLKNTLLIVSGYIETNDIIKAQNYINSQYINLNNDTKFFCNDPLINYFLSQKYYTAKENNILVEFDINISDNYRIDEEVLAVILANLLDNSIEACNRMKSKKRFIHLRLREKENKLILYLENSFNSEEQKRIKPHGHGIGLKNVRKLIYERKGVYQTEISGEVYKLSIILFKREEVGYDEE